MIVRVMQDFKETKIIRERFQINLDFLYFVREINLTDGVFSLKIQQKEMVFKCK